MGTIGNYFAIGILLVVGVMFLRNRYFISKATKYFRICLIFTMITALTNTVRAETAEYLPLPPVYVRITTTLDIIVSLLTTSFIALYLISKITEHALKEKSDFRRGKIIIGALYTVYVVMAILNYRSGFIFTVSETGAIIGGSFSYLPTLFLVPQSMMVLICCIVHKKTLSPNVKHSLLLEIPVILFCVLGKQIGRAHV